MFNEGEIPVDVLGEFRKAGNREFVQNHTHFNPNPVACRLLKAHQRLSEGTSRLHDIIMYARHVSVERNTKADIWMPYFCELAGKLAPCE